MGIIKNLGSRILSTLPAIAAGILGMFVGQILNLQIPKNNIMQKINRTRYFVVVVGCCGALHFL
jgi:hypothetical protein